MKITSVNSVNKKTYSIKTQTFAAFLATFAAIAIPQFFHIMGSLSGTGTSLGEAFLPMHLPLIFIGLLTGTYAGAITGILSPLISFVLTGMPTSVMLPFMMIELCTYGAFAGFTRNAKMPVTIKVLAVQLAGRTVRAVAILLSVYFLANTSIHISTIWLSIPKGIFGIALQLVLIPLMLYRVESYE